MKRILVAGGAGFIGSHWVRHLIEEDAEAEVHVVDNLWTGSLDNLHPKASFFGSHVEGFEQLVPFKYDEIYHFASPASPPKYFEEPFATISANVVGCMVLMQMLQPGGLFCYTSTSEVYGDPKISPQPETYKGEVDCTGPRAAYDEAKRCTEALLCTSTIDYRIVRLFNVYGPHTRPDDGRAVSNFIWAGLTGRPLIVHGDGSQTRSWGYISDIIRGMSLFFRQKQVRIMNIGNNREYSVLEIAKYIARLTGGHIHHIEGRKDDPTNRCPDLTLAHKIIPEWFDKPFIHYMDGIQYTLHWFKDTYSADLHNYIQQAPQPEDTFALTQSQDPMYGSSAGT